MHPKDRRGLIKPDNGKAYIRTPTEPTHFRNHRIRIIYEDETDMLPGCIHRYMALHNPPGNIKNNPIKNHSLLLIHLAAYG
jgi:hypothetical protein